MKLTFLEQSTFVKVRDRVFVNDNHFREFQGMLLENPEAGDRIAGAGATRKVRFNDPARSMGSRGGIRVIYAYYPDYSTILLLFAYTKKITDISPSQKKGFADIARGFVEELKEETQ